MFQKYYTIKIQKITFSLPPVAPPVVLEGTPPRWDDGPSIFFGEASVASLLLLLAPLLSPPPPPQTLLLPSIPTLPVVAAEVVVVVVTAAVEAGTPP